MIILAELLLLIVSVLAAIGIHFEVLNSTSLWLRRSPRLDRFRVALAIMISLLAHIIEVLVFGVSWLALETVAPGRLSLEAPAFQDLVYYSFATYTSQGYGDIVSHGFARIFSGVQGLTGLVLIGWTASFVYLEMRECWAQYRNT